MIQQLFNIVYLVLRAYSFIIFIRIIFSWFNMAGNSYGKSQSQLITYLYNITDPYLNWFKRFSFLRIGIFDFSAMLGIVLLYFVGNIFQELAKKGALDPLYLLSLIIGTIWSFVSSVLFIILIILVVRVIFILLNKYSQIFYTLDGYIESYARKVSNIFTKKFTPYKTNLIIVIVCILLLLVIGTFLIGSLQLLIR